MALHGGRTNLVFRCGELVVKLYRPDQANALFGNSSADEFLALTTLKGSGIAPEPIASLQCSAGPLLVYHHVHGASWTSDPEKVAILLGQLHARPLPDLPMATFNPESIAATGRRLLESSGPLDFACPTIPTLPPVAPAFIHGDITANNIVVAGDRLTLIDWQCARIGDPAEDLAGFLYPAMQVMFGPGLLSREQMELFLAAYPDPNVIARYRTLAPLFHWRMAAYCQWQVAQGMREYDQGLRAELVALANYSSHSHA